MSLDRIVLALSSPDPGVNRAIIVRARRRGFRRFTTVAASGDFAEPGEDWYLSTPDGFEAHGGRSTSRAAMVRLYRVRGPGELAPVIEALTRGEAAAVRWGGERVIPLETLVAARTAPGSLWVVTSEVSEIPAFLGALEHGADAVVVEVSEAETVDQIERRLELLPATLEWKQAQVRAVTPVGTGDRVIVDTTSMLEPEEGILVGSSAAFLFHVASEAVGSRYTRPRPFRVNAGSAHLYTLLTNGETRYLSELVPGDAVLVSRPAGAVRSVRVGRIKIERRPLLMIEGELHDRRYTVFLQEAETVRMSTDGAAVATTELRSGATVWGVALPAGRHLGVAVEETIVER